MLAAATRPPAFSTAPQRAPAPQCLGLSRLRLALPLTSTAAAPPLTPQAIKHAFAAADKDGNEELDVKELMEIMALLGSTMTEKEAEACLMILDKNGNNTVRTTGRPAAVVRARWGAATVFIRSTGGEPPPVRA